MPAICLPNPPISEIEPGLYLGDLGSSYEIPILLTNKITAMISLSETHSAVWSFVRNRELVPEDRHMFIPCRNTLTQDILTSLAETCDFIDEQHSGQTANNVLVHCTFGISRSPTIVVAYLMRKHRQSLDFALAFVKKSRNVKPNSNFMAQLAVWAEVEYEPWANSAKTIPKPPYAAYLTRRAERLRAKELTAKEPTYLVL